MELTDYIKIQLSERYRCFILCGAGLTGKTDRIKNAAKIIDGKYIDVLGYFSGNNEIQNIESIRPEQFLKLFNLEESNMLVFDNMDFLFCLWTENQQREFIRRLDMKSNGSCIVAVLHNYKILEENGIMRIGSRGQKRIVNIAEFT